MRARIALSGTLVIEPENELEGFALRCWQDINGYFDGQEDHVRKVYGNILFKDSVPVILRAAE